MKIVWRIREKIIRTVQCCTVYHDGIGDDVPLCLGLHQAVTKLVARVKKSGATMAAEFHGSGFVMAPTTVLMGRMNVFAIPVSKSPYYMSTV